MERLTTKRKDGRGALKNDDGATPWEQINKVPRAIDRLAAYEDTMSLERAQELAQAENDGRLVVLPCKPDATAYQWKKGDDIPSMFRLNGFSIDEDGEITYQTHWRETFAPDDFGKTVFLTYEEAEAALKKREDGENEAVR